MRPVVLDDETVVKIRLDRQGGATLADLAHRYNLSVYVVWNIVHGHIYANAGGPIEDVCPSKLSKSQVQDIRTRVASGESRAKLAVMYGVSRKTITDICMGYSHASVSGPITKGKAGRPGRLSEEQVVDIRERYTDGESASKLAEEYGAALRTIYYICLGRLSGPARVSRI